MSGVFFSTTAPDRDKNAPPVPELRQICTTTAGGARDELHVAPSYFNSVGARFKQRYLTCFQSATFHQAPTLTGENLTPLMWGPVALKATWVNSGSP